MIRNQLNIRIRSHTFVLRCGWNKMRLRQAATDPAVHHPAGAIMKAERAFDTVGISKDGQQSDHDLHLREIL